LGSGPGARDSWPALDVRLPHGAAPLLEELLLAILDDFEPSALDREDAGAGRLTVFFSSSESRNGARRAVRERFGADGVSAAPVEVPDGGWAARSQAGLRRVRIGRVVVSPPWDRDDRTDAADGVWIEILPSMGFGTGHHASTRLCVLALQRLDLYGRRVLDVGTGSGILAIAAVRLGAARAVGVDTDPDALAAARDNLGRNEVSGRVEFRQADLRDMRAHPAPVVTANLSGALLAGAAHHLSEAIEPGGFLIASGFTDADTDVLRALETELTLVRLDREDEWLCATLRRPG
jgi:ribosomal protein L11 methyltransferase